MIACGEASLVRTAARDEYSYETPNTLLREVAPLVGRIERLFPLDAPRLAREMKLVSG